MSNEIQRLLPRHFGLLRLVLAGAHSVKAMAGMMQMTEAGIRNIISSPMFQEELARRRNTQTLVENDAVHHGITQSKALLAQMSVAAAETMEKVMSEASDPKVQLDAADRILRHAYPKEDSGRKNNVTNVMVLSPEKLVGLREVLKEIGYISEENPSAPKVCRDEIPSDNPHLEITQDEGQLTLHGF